MKAKEKNWFTRWWVITIVAIIIIGFSINILWKSNPVVNNFIQNNIIDPIKDTLSPQNSSVELSDELNDTSSISSTTESEDAPGGGGGGGSGSSNEPRIPKNSTIPGNTTTLLDDYEIYPSLEELFNAENPVGNKVSVRGIALQITGVSTSDSFFFTDDENVISDITYMLFNNIEYHITVYNLLDFDIPQSIIKLTGIIVDCKNDDDGIYCVDAESIE